MAFGKQNSSPRAQNGGPPPNTQPFLCHRAKRAARARPFGDHVTEDVVLQQQQPQQQGRGGTSKRLPPEETRARAAFGLAKSS